MKLEIIHLIAYYPFALKVIGYSKYYRTKKGNDKILMLESIQFPDNHIDKTKYYSIKCTDIEIGYAYAYRIDEIQPILKPLSDLYPEITDQLIKDAECDAEIDFINALLDDKNSMYDKIKFAPFTIIQKLCELHFDIFGLIEKRLAVNYHSICKA